MTTTPTPTRQPDTDRDERIWTALFARLLASPFAGQAHQVVFTVRHGTVTMDGEVTHRRDIPRLLVLVWSVPGVAAVWERLTWTGASAEELNTGRCSNPDGPATRLARV